MLRAARKTWKDIDVVHRKGYATTYPARRYAMTRDHTARRNSPKTERQQKAESISDGCMMMKGDMKSNPFQRVL